MVENDWTKRIMDLEARVAELTDALDTAEAYCPEPMQDRIREVLAGRHRPRRLSVTEAALQAKAAFPSSLDLSMECQAYIAQGALRVMWLLYTKSDDDETLCVSGRSPDDCIASAMAIRDGRPDPRDGEDGEGDLPEDAAPNPLNDPRM